MFSRRTHRIPLLSHWLIGQGLYAYAQTCSGTCETERHETDTTWTTIVKRFIWIAIIVLMICPGWLMAQTSGFSIGVRGGGQTWLPASGEDIHARIGASGAVDVRYMLHFRLSSIADIGFQFGGGVGYGEAGVKGQHTDTYSGTDYLGHQMDYTIHSIFHKTDRFFRAEASLMLSANIAHFTFCVGPRFMMPFAAKSTLHIDHADLDASYSLYNTRVRNRLVTGLFPSSYSRQSKPVFAKYHVLIGAEVGYELVFDYNHSLGFQTYANIGVWDSGHPTSYTNQPLIQVEPTTGAANPLPTFRVNDIDALITGRRHLEFGLRVYYTFTTTSLNNDETLTPARDTQFHRNRILRDGRKRHFYTRPTNRLGLSPRPLGEKPSTKTEKNKIKNKE